VVKSERVKRVHFSMTALMNMICTMNKRVFENKISSPSKDSVSIMR